MLLKDHTCLLLMMPRALCPAAWWQIVNATAIHAQNTGATSLTLDEIVCVVDNVGAEENGTQKGEDGVLDRPWWQEDLEQAPHNQRHQAAKQHWAKEAARRHTHLDHSLFEWCLHWSMKCVHFPVAQGFMQRDKMYAQQAQEPKLVYNEAISCLVHIHAEYEAWDKKCKLTSSDMQLSRYRLLCDSMKCSL